MMVSRTLKTLLIAIIAVALARYSDVVLIGYEEVSLLFAPDAARAMEYGDRHFSSKKPDSYNIDVAAHFYGVASKLDTNAPYLHHQLARVAFLRGKYGTAMNEIDRQIELTGESFPNAYYVRGLIEGFIGDFAASEADYRVYLKHDPTNWAATNDLAWVLLRDDRPQEALEAIDKVLPHWQKNPWLQNSRATALHELHRDADALVAIQSASREVSAITPSQWLLAYPGNDPLIAELGADSLREAVEANFASLQSADKTSIQR